MVATYLQLGLKLLASSLQPSCSSISNGRKGPSFRDQRGVVKDTITAVVLLCSNSTFSSARSSKTDEYVYVSGDACTYSSVCEKMTDVVP